MSLHALFLAVLIGYALLQWWALPQLESAWSTNRGIDKIAKASVIAALRAARTVLQVAALTYGVLLAALWLLDAVSYPAAADGLRSRILLLEKLKAPLNLVKDGILPNLALWSALLGLGYLAYKRHYADLAAQVANRVQTEIVRLQAELEAGAWNELPPTAEMAEIRRRINEVRGYASRTSGEESQRANMIAEALQRKWIEADFFRRMNLTEETPTQPPLRQKLWPSLVVFFTSRGFARDTSALAKTCSHAGMVIICMSLVYVAGSGLDANLSARIVHAWELAVAADQKEATAAWEKMLATPKTDHQASPNPLDAQQAQALVRAFTSAYFKSPVWHTNSEMAPKAYMAEATAIRAHIVATEGAARKIPVQGTGDPHDVLFTATRDARLHPNRPTPLERKLVQTLLNDSSARASAAWQELNTKIIAFTAAYHEPVQANGLVQSLLGQVLDPVVEGLQPEVTHTTAKQFEKILGKGLKTGLERSIMTQFDRFLANVSGKTTIEAALFSVAKADPLQMALTPREIPEISSLLRGLGSEATRVRDSVAKPAFGETVQRTDDTEEIRRLAKAAHQEELRVWKNTGGRTSSPSMDFLAVYEDYFANSEKSASSTLRSQLLGESGAAPAPKEFADAAARARNFEKLSAFNRVGGVLIGRNSATDAPFLDGYSLRDEAVGTNRVALFLRNTSGGEIRLGPYTPDVIYRALLFAADGRPLVVTILNTHLGVQKVILHPALLDTAIGCEMIELDKFVFSYIPKAFRDAHSSEMRRVESYDALYFLASLQGARGLVKPEFEAELDARIAGYIENRSTEVLQSALNDPFLFSDSKRSPLAAGYHIYKKPVLDAMKMCATRRPDNLDSFDACLAETARTTTSSKTQVAIWFEQAKPLEYVSGVRDRPFTLDAELHFLAPPPNVGDHPILQFLIQDTDRTGGTNVWGFDTLTPSIENGIKELVRTNAQAAMILQNTEDFTVLQRLFRLVFDGQIQGPELLSQVAGLTPRLRTQAKDTVITPRWNTPVSSQGARYAQNIAAEYKLLATEAAAAAPAAPEARTALDILVGCAAATKSPDHFASADASSAYCSFDKVRDKLEALCGAKDQDGRSLICRLAAIANYASMATVETKLASMIVVATDPTPGSTAPKACRAPL